MLSIFISALLGFLLAWGLSKLLQREGYEGLSLIAFFGGVVFLLYMGGLAIVATG